MGWCVHNLGGIIVPVTFLLVEKANLRLHSKRVWGCWSPCSPSQEAEALLAPPTFPFL